MHNNTYTLQKQMSKSLSVKKQWDFNNGEEVEVSNEFFDFKKFFEKISSNWVLMIISLSIAITIAFILNRYTIPVYEVESLVLIKAPKELGNSVSGLLYGQEVFGRSTTNIENEKVLIRSKRLVDRTLRELKFNVSYYNDGNINNVELHDLSPIEVQVLTPNKRIPYTDLILCNIINNNKYSLEIPDNDFFSKLGILAQKKNPNIPKLNGLQGKFADTINVDGFKFVVNFDKTKNRKRFENKVYFQISGYDRLTKIFQRRLKSDPYSEDASILRIYIEGTTPNKLIQFIDKLVSNYIKNELRLKNHMASRTIEFINSQILYMSDSLSLVEDRLESFKKQNTNLRLTNEGSTLQRGAVEYEKERARIILNNQYLEELYNNINENQFEVVFIPSSVGINEPTLDKLISEFFGLQQDLSNIQVDGATNNPLVLKQAQRIESLKVSILQNIINIQNANNGKIEFLNSKIKSLRSSIVSLPTAERQFIDIQRNYELNEDLYMFLMTKKAEAGIARASNTVDYRIIDTAAIKGITPLRPSPSLNYTMAVILGTIIPILLLYFKDAINNKVDSKETLDKLTDLPVIGMVAKNRYGTKIISKLGAKTAIAESFRHVRSNLKYLIKSESQGKVCTISSSVSGEGKSFCSNNLAYIFSTFGKKVLLIDADMRKQENYRHFAVKNTNSKGLSDYLAGQATADEVTTKTCFANLSLITSGGLPPNPAELLLLGKMECLIDQMRTQFDYIFIDTPPIGLLSDSMELMTKANANLFVVRQGYTLKKQVTDSINTYKRLDVKHFAILLNYVNFEKLRYGGGYYEEYARKPWWKRFRA